MKNLSLPTYLLLCFFMLIISTPGQAITASTTSNKTETQLSKKQEAKIERLKKKLSRKIAKMNSKPTEAEMIQKKAKESYTYGLMAFLVFMVSIFGVFNPFLSLFFLAAIPLGIVSICASRKALKAIKNSKNPEAYREEKRKVKNGRGFAIAAISMFIALIGLFIYLAQYLEV